jgi:MYXO-CTERM domain-containing protein
VCWTYANPLGAAGTDSNICAGDSGGPLLADVGAGLTLAGVHSGGSDSGCHVRPSHSFDTDVFVESLWIRSLAGADLDALACGDGAQAGDPAASTLAFAGTASSQNTFRDFTIPAGVKLLRVGLTGEIDPASDLDLYARLGSRPTTSAFDCSSVFAGSLEYCEIADPPAGSGHALVRRNGDGSGYQLTVTMLPEDPPPPAPGPGAILVAGFTSFELVQVAAAGGQRAVVSSALRGAGPALAGPEGVALDADGSVLVANAFDRNLLRADRATGARTLVSGCADATCASTRGAGPPFLSPRFVARWNDGAWLVADRSEPGVWALVRVDPASGDRTIVSGCTDPQCAAVVGNGPAIGRLFGLAVEAGGAVAVADGRAVYRIDPANGDRSVLSGCADAACSTLVGGGPGFGEPVDLLAEPDGRLLVSYRIEGSAFGAILRVDPATGDRTLVSGCEDPGCTSSRGSGPAFVDLFGLAREAGGTLVASDAALDALLRVDPATGDRTLVSGCGDGGCALAAGSGPRLGEPVDLLVLPAPEPGAPGAAAAALALAGLAARRRRDTRANPSTARRG